MIKSRDDAIRSVYYKETMIRYYLADNHPWKKSFRRETKALRNRWGITAEWNIINAYVKRGEYADQV